MLINLGFLFLFTEIFDFYYMISAVVAGVINVTYNFVANNFWSFSDRNDIHFMSGYMKFIAVMVLYFAVYYGMLYVFTEFFLKDWSFYFVKGYIISSVLSTILATAPKYYLCFVWVWKNDNGDNHNEKN